MSPRRPVPVHIPKPPHVKSQQPPGIARGPEVHDEKGIKCMRASGRLAAQVLLYAGTLVKPGTKTDEIDEAVHQMIIENGTYPSPRGYGGSPKSVCTSVNECICHGIPDSWAFEPMLTMGSINPIMWDDNWTVVTKDGSLSSQFQHTILTTRDGAEILTQY